MKFAIDSTPLTVSSGGITRYTSALFQALTEAFPQDEFRLLTDQSNPDVNGFEQLWWMYGLPKHLRKMRVDLFHGTNFSVPYLPVCPSVMTVHDLSPWMNPEWHRGSSRVRCRTPWILRLGLATMVITDCQAVRSAVISRFNLPADRVVSVPLAAEAHFAPSTATLVEPYLLYVGTLEPRKNIPFLAEVWKRVYEQYPIKLILAGRRRDDCPPIPDHPALQQLGEVDEAALTGLYAGALAVVYPSLYEGFGLPVLEALASGAPVITSLDPALVELTSGAAMHCDASKPDDWVEAMRLLITQPARRLQLREQGLLRAKQFSWRSTALQTHAVYLEAIARHRRSAD